MERSFAFEPECQSQSRPRGSKPRICMSRNYPAVSAIGIRRSGVGDGVRTTFDTRTPRPPDPIQRKPWDSNPHVSVTHHLFSRQAPHPAG